MPLYTRLGDSGDTMLYGGEKVSKSNPRIHAYGTVDELDAILGIIRADTDTSEALRAKMLHMQRILYILKADLATPLSYPGDATRVTQEQVEEIEQWIDEEESNVEPLTTFIVPGGVRIAAKFHHARTVCRRAERWLVGLVREHEEEINFAALRYLNRLGDYLFALGRTLNNESGVEEESVDA